MIVILNQNGTIIAADREALEHFGVDSLDSLLKKQFEGALHIEPNGNAASIRLDGIEVQLAANVGPIDSIVGPLTAVRLDINTEEKASEAETVPLSTEQSTEKAVTQEPTSDEELHLSEETLAPEQTEPIVPLTDTSLSEQSQTSHSPVEENVGEEALSIDEEELIGLIEESDSKTPAPSEAAAGVPEEETLPILEPEGTEPASNEEVDLDTLLQSVEPDEETENTLSLHEEKDETPEKKVDANKPGEEDQSIETDELLSLLEEEHESEALNIPNLQEISSPKSSAIPSEGSLDLHGEKHETIDWKAVLDNFQLDPAYNAQKIGISVEEYSDLLREFIDESKRIRKQVLEEDRDDKELLPVFKDATTLLQLQPLPDFFDAITHMEPAERYRLLNRFETVLDRIGKEIESPSTPIRPVQSSTVKESGTSEHIIPDETSVQEENKPSAQAPESLTPAESAESVETPAKAPETTKGAIPDLVKGTPSIPIEFSVKVAAEELNLPEDLVLEFIHDFALQGHEYLPVLVEAYENGDLEKLQKTAHMLKGAASNLRLEPMVENLYELQFDNDISRAPERIKKFYGQLQSLDHYLEQIN